MIYFEDYLNNPMMWDIIENISITLKELSLEEAMTRFERVKASKKKIQENFKEIDSKIGDLSEDELKYFIYLKFKKTNVDS